ISCAVTSAGGGVCCAVSAAAPAQSVSRSARRRGVLGCIRILFWLAAPFLEAARYRACASRRVAIRSRSLWNNGGIESTQGLQIAKQIVEIPVAEPVGTEDRHRRFRVVIHGLHLVLFISLNPLARIHNLDREEVFVFLDALDRRPGRRCQRHRFETLAEALRAASNPQSDSIA